MDANKEKIEGIIEKKEPKNKVVLLEPINWDGKEYKDFTFNVNDLTGRDLIDIQTEMKMSGIPIVSSMRVDTAYVALVAAKSAGVDNEVIKALKFEDFNRVIDKVTGLMPW